MLTPPMLLILLRITLRTALMNPSSNASQSSIPWTPFKGTKLWWPSPWRLTRSHPPWWARCAAYSTWIKEILSTISSPFALDPFCSHLKTAPREIRKLLSEYPDDLSLDGFSDSTPKRGVFHNLPMVPGPPVFAKACRLDPDKLALPRLSSSRWRRLALYVGPPHTGPVLFTWSWSLMGPGGMFLSCSNL